MFWRCFYGHGGICPVRKTADMTQPVGVDQDGRLYTAPSGEVSQIIGTGTIHDTLSDEQHGTFDYVITGKIATITFHCESTWVTTCVGVALKGLPDGFEFEQQRCSLVNVQQTPQNTAEVIFYGHGCTVVDSTNEVYYGYNIRLADGFTFTVRIK